MEWILADRQGIDKNGKSNTQIKLGHSFLPVKEVIHKLIEKLNICCEHQCQYQWKNTMKSIDLTISERNLH